MYRSRKEAGSAGIRDRDFGADCVRITAAVMVLGLHFYLRNGFYYTEVTDVWGFIALMFQPVMICCVPLFMVLTGYLKCGKEWTPAYYRSLVPILISWAIISAVHLPYKILWQGQRATAGEWLLSFVSFHLAEYSWYVGMYTGLFLISPLLNLIWKGCRDRRMHRAAVLTLVALTFLPSTVNSLNVGENILPAYFQSVYYITYYMIGCYIRTYRPRPSRCLCAVSVPAAGAVYGGLNVLTRTEAANFYTGTGLGFNHLATAFMTVMIFLLVYRADTVSVRRRETAAHLAGVTYEIYLLSYIFDTNIYTMFYRRYPLCLYLPVGSAMVAGVFILSYLAALPVNRLSRRLTGMIMPK